MKFSDLALSWIKEVCETRLPERVVTLESQSASRCRAA